MAMNVEQRPSDEASRDVTSAQAKSAGNNPDKQLPTRWVLLAEDDDDIRTLIRDAILAEVQTGNYGMRIEVVEARDGLEALEHALTHEFHCVVTDLKMPRSSGEEFIRAMQAHPLNTNTPTLVVSGCAHDEFRDFCDSFSHIKIIEKPFVPQALSQLIMKEIKLGRSDDRASLNIMSSFVEATQKFLANDLKIKPELNNPIIKKAGESLFGDYFATLTISNGVSRALFTLSFDQDILDCAKTDMPMIRSSDWGDLNPQTIVRFLSKTIFEGALPQIRERIDGSPQLVNTAIITQADRNEYNQLLEATGMTVMINSPRGRICAGAFSLSKSKRS